MLWRGAAAAGLASLALTAPAWAEVPVQTHPVTVVPSSGLPHRINVDNSNANLSVAYFKHRVFLVFRSFEVPRLGLQALLCLGAATAIVLSNKGVQRK